MRPPATDVAIDNNQSTSTEAKPVAPTLVPQLPIDHTGATGAAPEATRCATTTPVVAVPTTPKPANPTAAQHGHDMECAGGAEGTTPLRSYHEPVVSTVAPQFLIDHNDTAAMTKETRPIAVSTHIEPTLRVPKPTVTPAATHGPREVAGGGGANAVILQPELPWVGAQPDLLEPTPNTAVFTDTNPSGVPPTEPHPRLPYTLAPAIWGSQSRHLPSVLAAPGARGQPNIGLPDSTRYGGIFARNALAIRAPTKQHSVPPTITSLQGGGKVEETTANSETPFTTTGAPPRNVDLIDHGQVAIPPATGELLSSHSKQAASSTEPQLQHPGPVMGALRTNAAKLGPPSANTSGGAHSLSRESRSIRGESGSEERSQHLHDEAQPMVTDRDDDSQSL